MLNSEGKLRIRANTAGGALPIKGAHVKIFGAEESNKDVIFSLLTDVDGITEAVTLPAPDKSFSQKPYPSEAPYAIYNVEITADGYYTQRINGLPIFAGIESYQIVNMIPGTSNGTVYPEGNTETTIPESNLVF